MHALSEQIMKEGRLPAQYNLATAMRPLAPRLEKAIVRLLTITNLNHAVHRWTYRKLMCEAAQALLKEA